jgi:hypothetical protein
VKASPTSPRSRPAFKGEDYGKKAGYPISSTREQMNTLCYSNNLGILRVSGYSGRRKYVHIVHRLEFVTFKVTIVDPI